MQISLESRLCWEIELNYIVTLRRRQHRAMTKFNRNQIRKNVVVARPPDDADDDGDISVIAQTQT